MVRVKLRKYDGHQRCLWCSTQHAWPAGLTLATPLSLDPSHVSVLLDCVGLVS